MVAGNYLASTVVMGLVVAGVVYAVVNGRSWKRYSPQAVGGERTDRGSVAGGRTWIVGFGILSIVAVGGTLAILQSGADGTVLIFGAAAVTVVSFLLVGTYATARSRGHPHAYAIGETVGMFGAVVILAIVVNLVVRFGA